MAMTGPPRRVLAWSAPVLLALIVLPYVVTAVPDRAAHLRPGLRDRRARLQPAAGLHRAPVLRPLRLLRHGRLRGGLHREVPQARVRWRLFLLGGILASGAVAALFGLLCVRYTRIFFGILTMALSQVLWSLAFKFFWVTGGSDGLRVPTPTLLGGLVRAGSDKFEFLSHRYYFYVLAIFVICVAVMWVIVHSPFGKALQAIRDNETRAEFVGVQVWHYRWVAFLISGIFTGLAGALWVPLNGLTTPDILHWTFSGKMVFFTVLGGFQTFFGPIIGAIIFNYLETYAVGHTVYWQMVLGVVLVVLVLALPAGIVGDGAAARGAPGQGGLSVDILKTTQLSKSFGETHAVDHVDFRGDRGRGARPHRLQRRGEDDPDQPDQRPHPARLRAHRVPGRRHHAGLRPPEDRARHRAELPARQPLRPAQRARQRDPGHLLPRGPHAAPVLARRRRHRGAGRGGGGAQAVRPRRAHRRRPRAACPRASASCSTWRSPTRSGPSSSSSTSRPAGSARARRRPIMDIITAVVRSGGITAVIVEHDMDVVFTYCPRIVAMHQGAILADGTPDQIRNQPAGDRQPARRPDRLTHARDRGAERLPRARPGAAEPRR